MWLDPVNTVQNSSILQIFKIGLPFSTLVSNRLWSAGAEYFFVVDSFITNLQRLKVIWETTEIPGDTFQFLLSNWSYKNVDFVPCELDDHNVHRRYMLDNSKIPAKENNAITILITVRRG
jgi:hypothetical protein